MMRRSRASGGVRCSVESCTSSSLDRKPIRFFRFPKPTEEIRVIEWKFACNDDFITLMDPVKLHRSKRICSLHFEERMMKNRKLRKDAIPTLNLDVNNTISLSTTTQEATPEDHIYLNASSTATHEDHIYFSDQNIEVAQFVEVDTIDREMISKYISTGTQTDLYKVDSKETQTV